MAERAAILDGAFLDALETLDLNVRQMKSGNFSGARRSRAYGSSPEFADYRDYAPGDDLRRIDWNAAGRFDKYLIKRFLDEKQGRNCVYLDASASMGFESEKGFAALRLTAALGYLSVTNMDSVSVRLLRGKSCTALGERAGGREAFFRLGRLLDGVQFSGDADLGACIRSDPNPGTSDGVSYLISDFLTDSDWRGAVDALLSRGREVALIQLLSPAELEPTLTGPHAFCDCEEKGGRSPRVTLDVDRDALKAYRETARQFLAEIRNFCVSRNVPYLLMNSSERAEDVLRTRGVTEELIR